jgi:amino acid transporter
MFVVLATTTPALASTRLDSFVRQNGFYSNSTNYYQSIINSPAAFFPTFNDSGNTLALNAVIVVGLSYIISSIYIAGEVKTVKRTMPFSILGALLITTLIFYLSIVLEYNALGYNFTASLYSLAIVGSPQYVIPVYPYLNILVGIVSGLPLLGAVLSIITLLQMLSYQASASFVGGRLLLAYSFDRIIPRALGYVSDRFHNPVKAIVTSLIIGLMGVVIFALLPTAIAFLLSSLAIAILIVFPILIAGVAVLRYRVAKSKEFKAGPLGSIWLGKLLVVSGAVTVVYSAFSLYQYVTDPALGVAGPYQNIAAEIGIGSMVILFVVFYVAKLWNQKRGVPFDVIFKELPPE